MFMCHSWKATFDLTKCVDEEVSYVALSSIGPEKMCNGNAVQSRYGMRGKNKRVVTAVLCQLDVL